MIRNLILCMAFFSSMQTLNAQIYLKVKPIGEVAEGCNNTVVIQPHMPYYAYYVFYVSQSNEGDREMNPDTLHNVCLMQGNWEAIQLNVFTTPNTVKPLVITSVLADRYNYEMSDYSEPSSDTSQDGSYIIHFDSVVNPVNFVARQLMTDQLDVELPVTWLDSNSVRVENVAFGRNGISLLDQQGFTIALVDADLPNEDPHMVGYIESVFASNGCDGNVEAITFFGQGTLTYSWSMNSNLDSRYGVGICPGAYTVTVTDEALDSVVLSFWIHEPLDPSSPDSTVYNDSTLLYYTPQDTALFIFDNCDFNYQLPVDSIIYTEALVQTWGDSALYAFTIYIYQDTNRVAINDTVLVKADENLLISSNIFCGELKSMPIFRQINLVRPAGIELLSISETALGQYLIYPNPVSEYLYIKGLPETNDVELFDVQGRWISSATGGKIFVGDLANGIYLLKVKGTEHFRRIVKH